MPAQHDTRARLLAVLAVIAVGGGLKVTRPVTLPLVTAIFILVLVWPLHARMERAIPRAAAYAITIVTVLATMTAFVGMIAWSLSVVMGRAPEILARIQELREQVSAWAQQQNLPLGAGDPGLGAGALVPALTSAWNTGAMLFITIAFFVLGLAEVGGFRDKLLGHLGARGEAALRGITSVGGKVRGFILALTLAGLLGGAVSALFGLIIGLEHVLVWAFLAYLLNYIPVVGSTLSVFPPTLWALVQYEGVGRPLLVLIGFGAIQIVVGNYIAPIFEGRYTKISPLVVLVSIVLWWWLWGPVGAVLGVPLTIAAVLACDHFDSTRWVAVLLSERRVKGR